ncbi:MAG TPA: hypothetical protein DHN33_01245 [Eubacteriaceae bacterium]|nr:hypothetical protein [Eubacteriaceae bacterium]
MKGNILLPGRVAAKITSHILQADSSSSSKPSNPTTENKLNVEHFTQREQDIIRCMLEGKSNAQIAETLFLTVGTVKNYLTQIYGKAGVTDRANAVLYFKQQGKG